MEIPSDAQTPEEAFASTPIPLEMVSELLGRIQVHSAPGELKKAWESAQQNPMVSGPTLCLRATLQALNIRGVRIAQLHWRRMDLRRLPALVFLNERWLLVERDEDARSIRVDELTETGEWQQSVREPEELQDGLVLWAENASTQTGNESLMGRKSISLLKEALFRTRRWLLDISAATIVVNLLAVATAMFAMQVYDRVVPTLAYATLWTLVAGMAIVVTLDWLLKTYRSRILDSLASEVDQTVSQQIFNHVMNLQLDTRPRSLGTMAAQVGGLESVRQFFSSGVVFTLVDMPFALMFIVFIAIIGGPVAWVYASLLPIALALGWYGQHRMRVLTKKQMMRSNERQGMLVDAINGTESIRASHAGWQFSERWQGISDTVSAYGLQQKAINNTVQNTTASLSSAAYIAAIVVGVGQVADGAMTMGAMIACSILGGRVIAPIAQGARFVAQWQGVEQALDMVDGLLKLPTERAPDYTPVTQDRDSKQLLLEKVRFSYPDSPVKQLDIDRLSFQAGQRVAVLGAIGSGKTTLLKVLAGLYRPREGRVILGEADLWEMHPDQVVEQVGYLPQSVHLFQGTLHSNLTLGGNITDDRVLEVAQQLGIDRIAADSPYSMQLPISEGGDGLSGGQKQLVGLGRMMVARPRIWLLDEPTASLDGASEQQVLQALEQNLQPQDILVISTHRVPVARRLANRLLVMQEGKVVEDGKPDQILAKLMNQNAAPNGPQPGPKGGPLNVI